MRTKRKVPDAVTDVAALESERGRLSARIQQLERERDTAAVERLGQIAAELGAHAATLLAIDERLAAARLALAEAQRQADADAVTELRPNEAAAFDEVVAGTLALRDALRSLAKVRRQLRQAGGAPLGTVRVVERGVKEQLRSWRVQQNLGGYGAGRVRISFDD